MLIGSYNHIVDTKGRVFVPAKWRDDLGSQFIVTRGIDGCLFGLPLGEWEKLSAKLAALPLTNKKAQDVNRSFTRWASACELDKQGRILVPQALREFAKIEGELSFIGVTTHIEIWSKAVLDERDAGEEDDYDEVMTQAAEFGI